MLVVGAPLAALADGVPALQCDELPIREALVSEERAQIRGLALDAA